ncbi:hypothetical protein AYO21_08221 [Fonsecaea monophora]|uniref:Ubiquitin-like domain-containing protein n=1 Tax=Fonsecaea monophora TaxID=254056 RepID=A0A177EZZ6_9EURO|nr:hypothetical protein AYO21_08221 [Fonsecaea monophora]OAG37613.1 hypothetical protein AYO21_08221 [Fonsecaea monophora]
MSIFSRRLMPLDHHFRAEIYVGGVNVACPRPGVNAQSHFILPDQNWIDGVSNDQNTVRQFVALGSEANANSIEQEVRDRCSKIGGRIEIKLIATKLFRQLEALDEIPIPPETGQEYQIFVKTLTGRTVTVRVLSSYTLLQLMALIHREEGTPPRHQILLFNSKYLAYEQSISDLEKTLEFYQIKKESTLSLRIRARGGGPGEAKGPREPAVYPGGLIRQQVKLDTTAEEQWSTEPLVVLNFRVVTIADFNRDAQTSLPVVRGPSIADMRNVLTSPRLYPESPDAIRSIAMTGAPRGTAGAAPARGSTPTASAPGETEHDTRRSWRYTSRRHAATTEKKPRLPWRRP